MIRVVVAEDSSTARELLVAILGSDPLGMRVVGEAKNGAEAVEMTKRLRPDVVTMDIRMPVLDGFEATRRIMIEAPTPVVVVSGSGTDEVETSLDALRAGALVVIEKPAGPGVPGFEERSAKLVETVRLMAGIKVVRRFAERPRAGARRPADDPAAGARDRVRGVAIAASTGGPAAIQTILSRLPADFPAPILVVQHIAKGFVGGLATWLNGASSVRVKADEPLAPGTAYIAPDDRHLGTTRTGRVVLASGPDVDGFRPSGTFLFESAARELGRGVVAVILTGMGRDGVEGLRRVRAAGGHILAQSEASSVVFGMPGAAVEAGLADEVVPLDEIAGRLVELAQA
jgi:two-component system chemotaxis response regulator CheB